MFTHNVTIFDNKYFNIYGLFARDFSEWTPHGRIFLLSSQEARLLFDSNSSRRAGEFANTSGWWWLRSPGQLRGSASGVNNDGSIDDSGRRIERNGGVRPALWLNLE